MCDAAQGGNGPVHAVFAENWVVYTYWSALAHRFRPDTPSIAASNVVRQCQRVAHAACMPLPLAAVRLLDGPMWGCSVLNGARACALARWQASVAEVYDASARDLSPLRLVLGASNDTLSSYRPLQLQAPPRTTLLLEGLGSTTFRAFGFGPMMFGRAPKQHPAACFVPRAQCRALEKLPAWAAPPSAQARILCCQCQCPDGWRCMRRCCGRTSSCPLA